MMPNRVCAYCGDKYYVCRSCISIHSVKNVCCSVACYRHLIESGDSLRPKVYESGVSKMATVLRAGLTDGKTIDIQGYDLEMGKFDCSDNRTRTFTDFQYFIVPSNEFADIAERLKAMIEEAKTRKEVKEVEVAKPQQTSNRKKK